MHLHQPDQIRYYTFEIFETLPVVQAIFTRQGGVSPEPWASLNTGSLVGDEPANVLENRRRSFEVMGRSTESMYDVWQVHGIEVVCADSPRPVDIPHLRADAILTDRPEVTLFMRFADCVPIFLYDPRKKVVGLVHAGWQGTVKYTAAYAVEAMRQRYRCDPQDILAGIGPSIGPHHYEIGQEVADQVRQAFGQDVSGLLHSDNGFGVQFDLWNANRLVLEKAGVRQIEVSEICTACHLSEWYSHRGERGRTGRFGALMALKP
ncbi:MAG: peptidoglycan editing factor PgeF [Anaerolineales bacterium]|nr:peptidoglycan editing factor PgeF [Anaerolineales bacterium]